MKVRGIGLYYTAEKSDSIPASVFSMVRLGPLKHDSDDDVFLLGRAKQALRLTRSLG